MSKVQQGQSFLDMLIQTSGSIDNAIAEAKQMNLQISDKMKIGAEVQPEKVLRKNIAQTFNNKRPATALPLFVSRTEDIYGFPYLIPLILA